MPILVTPETVDHAFSWPLGKAERMAKRGLLPHVRLPDGSVRFDATELPGLMIRVGVKEKAGATKPVAAPAAASPAAK